MNPLTIKTVASIRESLNFPLPKICRSYVGGAFLEKNTNVPHIPLVYPATGEHWAELIPADQVEVDAAVISAAEAFANGPWPGLSMADRQRILGAAGQKILDHAEELAVMECLSTGLPLQHLLSRQMPRAAENFFFYADYIDSISSETFSAKKDYSTTVSCVPAGVALALSPWNASLAMASMQIASCIAFGNTCISKPSEHSPAAVLRLAQLLSEAGLPNGVVNVICGGPETGNALVQHPGVTRIAFTGKSENGRDVMAAAAANLTPVKLGLSAKSANLVFADADMARAVDGSVVNAFSNSGQICVAGSRILVQEEIAEQFIDAFISRVHVLKVGDPMDPSTDVGPLGYCEHRDQVLEYFQLAQGSGAKILAGGKSISGQKGSCFVQPTVVLVDNNNLRICQDEVFGPLATIQVFKTEDDAIRICNDSRYGLLAYIWTSETDRIARLQDTLQVGSLWVNTPLKRDLRAPFGGYKESGVGSDGPRECADFYTEAKTVIVAT